MLQPLPLRPSFPTTAILSLFHFCAFELKKLSLDRRSHDEHLQGREIPTTLFKLAVTRLVSSADCQSRNNSLGPQISDTEECVDRGGFSVLQITPVLSGHFSAYYLIKFHIAVFCPKIP